MAVEVLERGVSAARLAGRLAALLPPPAAVVTMGSPWRGDDALGMAVAAELGPQPPDRLFNVETAPESYLVPIARCGARSCILVDALDAARSAGDILLLDPEDLEHADFTTHGLSTKAFLQALRDASGMRLLVLGVQPGTCRQGETLSAEVAAAARTVAEAIGLFQAQGRCRRHG